MTRALPDWPECMRRSTAAAYLDMPVTDFDREVAAGRLPLPFKLGKDEHWSRDALRERIREMSGGGEDDWRRHQKAYAA